jgi:hypothetical protein
MIFGEGHKVVQGLAGLAAGRGLGCALLQVKSQISERGLVRANQPAPPFICINCGEHCRRTWARKLTFICAILAHRSRFAQGDRNPPYSCGQTGNRSTRRSQDSASQLRRDWKNDTRTNSRDSGKEMKSLFATHYSLLTPMNWRSNV